MQICYWLLMAGLLRVTLALNEWAAICYSQDVTGQLTAT